MSPAGRRLAIALVTRVAERRRLAGCDARAGAFSRRTLDRRCHGGVLSTTTPGWAQMQGEGPHAGCTELTRFGKRPALHGCRAAGRPICKATVSGLRARLRCGSLPVVGVRWQCGVVPARGRGASDVCDVSLKRRVVLRPGPHATRLRGTSGDCQPRTALGRGSSRRESARHLGAGEHPAICVGGHRAGPSAALVFGDARRAIRRDMVIRAHPLNRGLSSLEERSPG